MDLLKQSKKRQNALSINLCGVKLRNPLILASGILGITGPLLRRVAEAGAAAVTSKSISVEPREGYDNPTIVEVEGGIINAVGNPNPGHLNVEEDIVEAKKGGIPVFASIMAPDPEGFAEVASSVESYGADVVELNVSCPHVEQMGAQIGQDFELLREVVKRVKSRVNIPVFVKLTPNVTSIIEEGKAAEEGGADALVAINTIKAITIDVDSFRPILSNRVGGLSGPAVKPVALRCVYELFENVDIPIVGVGGIIDWKGAVEFFLAGARCIQIGTAIAYRGLKVFEEINKGLADYLESNQFSEIDEIIGLAHNF